MFQKHEKTLREAVEALHSRGYWSAYPEIPSGKIYGENARAEGAAAYEALLGKPFVLPSHPGHGTAGQEVSPYGGALSVRYPAATADELLVCSRAAAGAWASCSIRRRAGICLEILDRLNQRSFLMANAVMNTSGQAFPMAFQAGGPHAQDRGLEAVARAWVEMMAVPAQVQWRKPAGRGQEIVLEKHWRVIPRGVSLVVGCQTFPTWNSYSGLFSSLVTGNTVIAKPHPMAILPMAITVAVAREVLQEAGLPMDIVLLGAEDEGGTLAARLATDSRVALIDYTGSTAFGQWLRDHAATPLVFTEETGVNTIVLGATDDFQGMCDNIAFSLALYSGQMCTAPQNVYLPRSGIETDVGHRTFDEVAQAISSAIDEVLGDPGRAAQIAGAIANPATLERIASARCLGRVIRESSQLDVQGARTATPLLLAVDGDTAPSSAGSDDVPHERECFGPIAFLIAAENADAAIRAASELAKRKGAITAALYDTDHDRIERAIAAFADAGVNLSINLTGNVYVNQSAAFSDFHGTGANPAGNASLTDGAFVASRFRTVMWRRSVSDEPEASS
ncbi:MAG: phenylacetic acid degradation protein PaaN [Lautropia sp.]|nr:phenylacetic acid degradation protein PaaN [Lautropia sp.]